MSVQRLTVESGYLVIEEEQGRKRKIPCTDFLRAADAPDLNISSLTLLTNLAQVVSVVVKTLVEQGLLSETLVDGYDLQYVADTLENDLNAEF